MSLKYFRSKPFFSFFGIPRSTKKNFDHHFLSTVFIFMIFLPFYKILFYFKFLSVGAAVAFWIASCDSIGSLKLLPKCSIYCKIVVALKWRFYLSTDTRGMSIVPLSCEVNVNINYHNIEIVIKDPDLDQVISLQKGLCNPE